MLTILQQKILDAHSRGDTRELARLQAEYRNSAVITSSDRGPRTLPPRSTVEKPPKRPRLTVVTPTLPEPARVELRESASPRFEVHLYERAREFIGTVAWGWRNGLLESGAWLYGEPSWQRRRFDIALGIGPGPGAKHEPDSVTLDWGEVERLDERIATAEGNLRLIGDVHTHHVDATPSPRDLNGWLYQRDRLERERGQTHYVALILTAAPTAGRSLRSAPGSFTARSAGERFASRPA
jgi:hypothetical protein